MITFDAIAPDDTRERLRFETQAEADAAGPRARPDDQHRETGRRIAWISWSEGIKRFIIIPEW